MKTNTTFICAILFAVILISPFSFSQSIHTLHPKPKASFERSGQFILDPATALIVPAQRSQGTIRAIAFLQKEIRKAIGDTLQVLIEAQLSGRNAIRIGEHNSYALMTSRLKSVMPAGETVPPPQGYIIDINAGEIILAGSDQDGTFNGVSTLVQLFSDQGNYARISSAHIWDYPDYPIRWNFSMHNLRGANAITTLRTITDTMVMRKLNGYQHTDFKYGILQQQPNYYFDSVRAFRKLCDDRNIEIIPGVMNIGYSTQILYTNPELAEGVPATAPYIIEGDTGRLVSDTRAVLPNGNFEGVTNNQFTGWNFYDSPNVSIFVDKATYHGGSTSARCTDFRQGNASGNARFNRLVNCQQFRHYLLSAYIKTQNFSGDEMRLFAYGQDAQGQYRPLSYTDYSIPATTNGWMRVEVRFNSLMYEKVLLYIGVWGGNSGTIWFDDFQIQDAGLTNVLRRKGAPLKIINKNTGVVYQEGLDFQPIIDSKMMNSGGNYGPYHQPPTLRRTANSSIKNGDTLLVSFYHPLVIYSDVNGNGASMVCVSEDSLYSILTDQTRRVDALYSPKRFFMGHDEIRNMNWDDGCQKRNLSPAKLLADNVQKCSTIIQNIRSGAQTFVWSDMFDSLHNAHDLYYLVNGDLTGSWKDIPKSVVIANWNGGKSKQSLQFFAGNSFSQITAPYYDVGNTSTIRAWRIAQQGIPNVLGMMYTTWNNDFRFLTAFGDYAWSAGPFMVHTPLDTTVINSDRITITATVRADEYDNSDAITSVVAEIVDSTGNVLQTIPLNSSGSDQYSGIFSHVRKTGFRYRIVARNQQGFTRTSPTYIVPGESSMTSLEPQHGTEKIFSLGQNFPNPCSDRTTINYSLSERSIVRIKIYDTFGRVVTTLVDGFVEAGKYTLDFDTRSLPEGMYVVMMHSNGKHETQKVTVFH